jgi:hypothetical protein
VRLPSTPVRIAAASVVLALALVGVVVREGVARAGGQEVRLAITGYDPRSLLTGHYVQFQLVDTVPAEQMCVWKDQRLEAAPGGVWFALRREGQAHRILAAAPTRGAALRLGEVAVRGGGACYGVRLSRRTGQEVAGPITASVDIGVDRIHLDQAEAESLEKALRDQVGEPPASWAVVSVGRDGKARLKGLIVGDRRANLSWF